MSSAQETAFRKGAGRFPIFTILIKVTKSARVLNWWPELAIADREWFRRICCMTAAVVYGSFASFAAEVTLLVPSRQVRGNKIFLWCLCAGKVYNFSMLFVDDP